MDTKTLNLSMWQPCMLWRFYWKYLGLL